jgi:murein DD-endopeptidase MepM/ murein hydrolase activator NlpD
MLYFRLRDPRIPVKSTSSAFAAGREVKGLTGLFLTLIFQGLNLAERLIFRKRRGAMATISAHFKKVFFYVYPISAIVIIFLAQTPPAGAGPEESTTHGKDISTQQRIPPYVVAVNGEAFVLDQNSDGIKVTSVKTSLPVFKAFCLANDQKTLLYMPLRNGIPSGELYVEDLLTGDLKKISSHLVLEAACSPTNSNEVAYTFSGGDAFGLATLDLVSGNVRTLLPSGVLADFLQWDDSGKGIYYFQVIGGDQPILDSISFKVMEVKPYTVLSPRYISVKTGTSQEVLPSDLPAGFPVLNSPIIPGLFSQPVTEEKAGLPENLYSFRTFSPDRSYEVFGDNLLGSGGLYVRSLQTGDTRPIGEGKVLKILQTGIVVKVFNAAGAEFQFIAWNGKTTWLGATAVSYNLPLKSFLVTQGGQSYPPPGNCQIYSHTSSSGSGYAYDMQSSTTGAHVLASAAGLVVYARSSVNCNVCDDGSDGTGCVDYFRGNCPSAGDYQWAGNTVIIQHADGSYTQYAHMQPNSVQVSVGSNVCQGLYIGNQGHTGCTKGRMNGCGDHLHFQRQSSSVPSGPSIPISFSDAPSNPLYCSISYTSGSTEVTSCAQPNLTPYQPSGWSDKIVVSKTTGTNTDSSPLYTTDTLYVDWAVINNGTAATTTTYYTTLYVDGVARQSWPTSPPHNPNSYVSVTDYSIGTLSAGTHTIKIVTDATGVVAESNEGDNEYTKTITVTTPPPSASITTKLVTPSTITLGESFTVSVTGKNNGGTAGWGGISVSFPQLVSTGSCPGSSYSGSEATVTGSSTTLSLGFYHKGCPISSSGGSMSAQYLLAEGSKSSWGSNESHSMTLTVTPKVTGTFTVYIRMALCQASNCSSSQPISRDPTSGSPTDQQGYAVYSFSVTVNPAHTLTITSGPSGTPNPVASGGTANLSVTAADSLGHSLSYAWTASCPTLGSNGSFSNANAQNPSWTAPTNTTGSQQNCTIQVTVSDGQGLSQTKSYSQGVSPAHTLTITSGPSGTPNPVASGGTANLSVTAADSLGHSLSYAWTASCPTLGSNGSFSNANAQNPTWTAPTNTTGSQQNCTIRVTVSDGQGLSQSGSYSQGVSPAHTLTITSGPSGTPNPVASGGTANLSVTAADSLGHSLSYAWTASCPTLGSNGSFSNANAQNPSWTAPTNTTGSQQNCTIQVTVSDGQGLSQTKSYSQGVSPAHTLTITSGPSGTPNPVASGGTANLSVTAADSLGHSLSYAWTASCPTLGSNGSFSNANAQNPSWTAPTNTTGSQQNCTIQVTVSDGQGLSQTKSYSQGVSPAHTLTITSGPSGTPNPVASGGTANLSVTAADSLGHSLSYQWSSSCPTLGSNGSFSNANAQNPSWTAPTNTTGSQQNCTIRVTVSDGQGLSQTGSYSQGVSPAHTLTITSGPSGTPNPVASGGTANLSVTAADSLGHSLSYQWSSSCPTLGSNGSFSNANAQNPSWTAPTNTTGSQQNCTIRVTVSDGQGLSQTGSYSQGVSPAHTLTITSGPSGTPNPVASGGTANLSVTAADSLGHSLSYAWTASCPTLGSNGSFSNANAQNPTWTAPTNTTGSQQNCTIRVTVSDGQGLSQSGSYSQGVSPAHTLTITSGPSGTPNPVASGGTANLSVTAADSLGHSLSYAWTASCPTLGSNGSFSNANAQNPTWTAPTNTTGSQQNCTIRVTVSDGQGLSQSGSYSQGVSPVDLSGAIQVRATRNGSSWSGSVSYTLTGPTTINGASVPATFANSPTGTYTLTFNSGGPSGACLIGITPSPTQTLNPGGTITFTLNFSTSCGTIQVKATLNGASWSGSVSYTLTGPTTINGASVPATFANSPTGTYTLTYNSGGPSGATFVGITPSPTQTLLVRRTLTFTLNFSRPVDEVEPNDTTSQAQIVSIPSIVNGSASPGGDPGSNWYLDYNGNGRFDAGIDDLIEDFFRISVNVYRMTLTITLDTPNRTEANLNLYIARLVGSQLSILSWSALDGTPPERITTSLTRGTYYVIVTNFDPGPTIPTSYTLTISSSSGAGLSVSGGESQSSIRKRTGSLESLSQEFESPVVPPPPILAVVRKRLYPHGEA